MFEGIYPFMFQDEVIAEIEFKRNYFYRIKKIHTEERFPLFLSHEKDLDRNYQLSLFFKDRVPLLQNPNYNHLSLLEWNRYLSLFDDYWVKIDEKEYRDLHRYDFESDPVVQVDLCRKEPNGIKYSPNLSLNQAYFYLEKGERYLLLPYTKKKKQLYDLIKRPYTVQIKATTPFIQIPLPKGQIFRFESICGKTVSDKERMEYLKKLPFPYEGLEEEFDFNVFFRRLYLVKEKNRLWLDFI